MKKYKVEYIDGCFDIFLGKEIEAENEMRAMAEILYEILDDLANYIELDLIEVNEDIDYDEVE